MTDNEIIKALEYCSDEGRKNCKNCPIYKVTNCFGTLSGETVDLINRLQAENNTLKYQVNRLKEYDERRDIALHSRLIVNAKAEARKEFAERLKEKAHTQPIFDTYCGNKYMGDVSKVYVADIDNLVKEMVGEN